MENPFLKIRNYPSTKKCIIYFIFSIICVLLIAIIALSIYAGMVYYIKSIGIKLVPSQNYPVTITKYYRQNDSQWSEDTIGTTAQKMRSTGCLISSVSTAISNLNIPITPKEFNNKLTQNNGFQGADLIWYKINESIPKVNYRYSRIFSSRTIENDLKKGLLPIVNVKYHKTGVTHWVLIVGAEGGEFLICDPLDDGISIKFLSEHGNVYAYRVIENKENERDLLPKLDETGSKEADKGITNINERNSALESKSAIAPYKPFISEEAIKLKSLEKTFLDSDFYRKERMIPLTVSRDLKYFVAYKIRNENMSDKNELVLIGMPRQLIDLYLVDLSQNKAVNIGKTEFVISHGWSEDGKLLSLVFHKSVKILNIAAASLSEVPMQYETDIYNTNWGSDNRTLYIHLDTVANYYAYDMLSKEMVKVRGRFEDGDTVYRGNAGSNILASKGGRVGTAKGLYCGESPGKLLFDGEVIIHDVNEGRILVSYNSSNPGGGTRYTLEDYDANTGENRVLYNEGSIHSAWKIYKASYLKTTGDVIYTTFETNGNGVKYLLVRIEPDGKRTVTQVPSPLYTVTPGENILHFAVFKDGESCIMDTASFKFIDDGHGKEYKNIDIRNIMFRALNIYSSDTPNIEEIRQIFINTYNPIPQEALENILLEAENTQSWKFTKQEISKNVTMTLKLNDSGNRASLILTGGYYRGPHELVKKEDKWYVTGFSTWPESKVRNDVYKACTRYIENEIKTGEAEDEINRRGGKADYVMKTTALLNKIRTQSSKIEVGEIELWAMSDPHRSVYPDAKEARVKIVVTLNDGSTEKYQAYFSRADSGDAWVCKGLGKLSASLFPR